MRESLLDRVNIPIGNIHPMPTHLPDVNEAARAYEATLQQFFGTETPRFDLVLLGMGADGHTASLFPGTPPLSEQTRWVTPGQAPVDPPLRLTLTFPVILNASAVYFLISGKDKATTLQEVLKESADFRQYPSAAVLHSATTEVVCWMDQAAAALLDVARS